MVSPQPVTVATCPVYSGWVEAGRHTGEAIGEKVRGEERVMMEMS